ncbi:hypothetical protein F7725_008666 [Dissostichus mawsoni]|uniref:D-aminoacyl-tRNA deacylase n=1 Tax=Dissostichus mawsoni TaxID=36200 RepID=A0A7J5Y8N1_DISMA|nr:hypothetical protein F7725_008666 [Dissostichus mawsoni]
MGFCLGRPLAICCFCLSCNALLSTARWEKHTQMTEARAVSASGGLALLQQCLRAKLQVKPEEEQTEAQFVQIDRGMVIYICFFKGATDDILPKMVRLGKMVSVLDLPGSVLIVPQATLGGKVKGRAMQYHNNIGKEDGKRLYDAFVSLCEKEVTSEEVTVKHGTYGNRQVLNMDTNGPYTHLMEF